MKYNEVSKIKKKKKKEKRTSSDWGIGKSPMMKTYVSRWRKQTNKQQKSVCGGQFLRS